MEQDEKKASSPNHAVVVRTATLEDLEAVTRLDQALIRYDLHYDATLDPEWTFSEEGLALFKDRITRAEGVAYVAEDGGQAIAYLTGAIVPADSYRTLPHVAELECLLVDDRYRGRGIGEKLVARFQEWAVHQGVARMQVVVSAANEGAIRFYRRTGFKDYDLVLEKSLVSNGDDPGERNGGGV